MSVLSALEGLAVAAPSLKGRAMPIALGVLIALFLVQRWGTGLVGRFFGPVMLLYFATLAITGIHRHGPRHLPGPQPRPRHRLPQ
jgi:KUP system potassium uptake protein